MFNGWVILLLFTSLFNLTLSHSHSTPSESKTYAICESDHDHFTRISSLFSKHDLTEECQGNFLKNVLNESLEHHHDHHEHLDHHPLSSSTVAQKLQKTSPITRFIYGLLAVIIVSTLSLVGLLALPILYKVSFEYVLKLFTAIAIGTLFGDAMFHLIPIVFDLHKHNHDDQHHSSHHDHHYQHGPLIPSYQRKMLFAVSILYIFYLLEIFLHWFAHYKHDQDSDDSNEHSDIEAITGHHHHHHHHGHHHNHSAPNGNGQQYSRPKIDPDIEHSHLHHNHTHHNLHQHLSCDAQTPSICSNSKTCFHSPSSPCTPTIVPLEVHLTNNPFAQFSEKEKQIADVKETDSLTPKVFVTQFSNELEKINPIVRQLKSIKSTGWMVLFGDSIHNFADGLAISAAFSQDPITGITTTIAVACHELPHELGDYAVLLQSGFSHSRALLWNFLSATTAILGYFVGWWVSNTEHARQWIYAATIGMFLYIALVDLLPTLLSDGKFKLKRFIVVNCGFLFGVTVMFLLAIFEDEIIKYST